MHPYYQQRIEEAPFDSFVVLGAIVLVVVIILASL
jgi:hypothetical protein